MPATLRDSLILVGYQHLCETSHIEEHPSIDSPCGNVASWKGVFRLADHMAGREPSALDHVAARVQEVLQQDAYPDGVPDRLTHQIAEAVLASFQKVGFISDIEDESIWEFHHTDEMETYFDDTIGVYAIP